MISIVDDFEQIAAVGVGHGCHDWIIEDQQLSLSQCLHELGISSISTPEVELGARPGHTRVVDTMALAGGLMGQRTSKPGLAYAGGTLIRQFRCSGIHW